MKELVIFYWGEIIIFGLTTKPMLNAPLQSMVSAYET